MSKFKVTGTKMCRFLLISSSKVDRFTSNHGQTKINIGVDLHKKVGGPWTKYKQNANLGNSYCSYTNLDPSSKYRGQSVFKYIQNFYFKHWLEHDT